MCGNWNGSPYILFSASILFYFAWNEAPLAEWKVIVGREEGFPSGNNCTNIVKPPGVFNVRLYRGGVLGRRYTGQGRYYLVTSLVKAAMGTNDPIGPNLLCEYFQRALL